MTILLTILIYVLPAAEKDYLIDSIVRKAETVLSSPDTCLPSYETQWAYSVMSEYYEKRTYKFSKAIYCKKKLADIATQTDNDSLLVSALASIARLYVEKARYDEAYNFANQALAVYGKNTQSKYLSDIYNTLGKISYYCNDQEKAIKYYRMISELPTCAGNLRSKVLAINNSMVFLTDTAEIQNKMNAAIDICIKEKYTDLLSILYSNLSIIYVNFMDLAKAKKNHALEASLPKGIYNSLNYYRTGGIIALESGDYVKARDELEKALEYADMGEFDRERATILSIINIVYAKLGEYELAYNAISRFNDINNKMPKNKVLRELFEAQQKAALESEKQKRKYSVLILIIIILVAFAIIYPLYINKVRRLKEKTMRLENEKIRKEKEQQEIQLKYEIREQNIKRQNDIIAIKRIQQYQAETLINDIISKLKNINAKLGQKRLSSHIFNVISELEHSKDNIIWEEMEQYLSEANTEFYNNLLADFPDLTVNERRLCMLLHMNMTTKEISAITRKSINSITTARSRLRTKLKIKGDDQSIVSFLDKYSGNRHSEEVVNTEEN